MDWRASAQGIILFRPINDHHAIEEVAFVLTFERPFQKAALDDLFKEHGQFKKELPRADRHEVFQFAIGNGPTMMPPPAKAQPLSFTAFKRDASIDWRLYVEDNALAVNCLTYTRWKDISDRALNILKLASRTLMRQANNGIIGISLQYIDAFKWAGKTEDYDVSLLIRENSDYIPKSIFDNRNSALWHLHQGWFSNLDLAIPGRTLHRIHLDAALIDGSYLVRMDSFLRLDPVKAIRKAGEAFYGEKGGVGELLDQLHLLDKEITRSYITDEMARRINLDGGRVADS